MFQIRKVGINIDSELDYPIVEEFETQKEAEEYAGDPGREAKKDDSVYGGYGVDPNAPEEDEGASYILT